MEWTVFVMLMLMKMVQTTDKDDTDKEWKDHGDDWDSSVAHKGGDSDSLAKHCRGGWRWQGRLKSIALVGQPLALHTRIWLFPRPGWSVADSHLWVLGYLQYCGYVAPLWLLSPLAGKERQKLCLPLSKSFFNAWLTPSSLLFIVVSLIVVIY